MPTDELTARGIEIRLKTRKAVTETGVPLQDGTECGRQPSSARWQYGASAGDGIRVSARAGADSAPIPARVMGKENVWAMGDCGRPQRVRRPALPHARTFAVRQGRQFALNICVRTEGARPVRSISVCWVYSRRSDGTTRWGK